jgi:SAM-dependent methyltransferase
MTPQHYVGTELDLFEAATNWKSYWGSRVRPYLGPRVLEIGAGHGGTTRVLATGEHEQWDLIEPDPQLADTARSKLSDGVLPSYCNVVTGTIADVADEPTYDAVLYIDVLEHLADDSDEVVRAARRLKPGGHLIGLSPAHQWLFTPFDQSIGHERRYSLATWKALTPASGLEPVVMDYLDSVGLFASLANRLMLRQSMPTPKQIGVWDKLMVPVSRVTDRLIRRRIGKSVLGVWRRTVDEVG